LHEVAERIGYAARDLALLAELMHRIETEPLTAPRLAALQSALITDGLSASRAIARLTQLVSWRESSLHNLLFMPLTTALLVPEHLALAINRWQAACGTHVADWLRIVGELEALSALALYSYEHPADPCPALAASR